MKLPVFSTIKQAFDFFWRERDQFINLAFPPIVILSILYALIDWQVVSVVSASVESSSGFSFDWNMRKSWSFDMPFELLWLSIGATAIFVILSIMYSVSWHRSYLVPEEKIKIGSCYKFNRRQGLFFWAGIKLTLVLIPLFLLVFFVQFLSLFTGTFLVIAMSVVLFPLVGMVASRLSIMYPAAAIDRNLNITEAFVFTNGNGWRLFWVVGITSAIVFITNSVTSLLIHFGTSISGLAGSLTHHLLANLAHQIVLFAGMAVGVSVLSIAYHAISKEEIKTGTYSS